MSTLHRLQRPSPGPGRRRGADSEGRERLLDAAVTLFSERGVANTTVAQIAKAGRVTSAMVHYWFETRDKLLDAVAEERMVPVIREIWEAGAPKEESATELVHGLLVRMLDLIESRPWLASLWLREVVQEGGLLREKTLSRIPMERNVAFRQRIAKAQVRGEINPHIVPELLFFSMLGLVMLPAASIRSKRRFGPMVRLERPALQRHVLGLVMNGLSGTGARRARS